MRVLGVGAVVAAALATTGVVLAGNPTKEKIARTAAGDAQAKAEVVQRADLGAGWKGGFKKPDLSSSMPCTSYRPRQSDLVLIGVAETMFSKPPFAVDSEVQVLRTASMVQRDWQRTVLDSRVIPCLRQGFSKALGSSAKLVSFGWIAFPRVTRLTRAFRAVFTVNTQLGPVPVEIDFIVLGSGRNELTLTLSGPTAAKTEIRATAVRLARRLAERVRP